jgi:prophage regulatory protein
MNLLRKPAVLKKTGLSYPTIYRKMQSGTFPLPVQLGPNSVAWIEEEIDDWSAARPRASIKVKADAEIAPNAA